MYRIQRSYCYNTPDRICFDDEDGEKYCICVMLAIYAPDRDGFLTS